MKTSLNLYQAIATYIACCIGRDNDCSNQIVKHDQPQHILF